MNTDRDFLAELLEILRSRFSEEELRDLCFHLGVDYYDLTAESRAGKARELLIHLEQRDRIGELVTTIQQQRPDIPWPPKKLSPSSRLSALEQLPPSYDVFLSYNIEDQTMAEQIAKGLKDVGLRVNWELRPGQTWLEALVEGANESKSTVVLVGPSGIGDWADEEAKRVLQKYVQEGKTIIPVILPGVASRPRLPSFLGQRAVVDCRAMQISYKSLDSLLWGITGRKPVRSVSQVGDEFLLSIDRPGWRKRTIKVLTLPNPDPDQLLYLTWETFGKGIETLHNQITNYGFQLSLHACIGINDAGLVMATFLKKRPVTERVKIGYIRCEGTPKGRTIFDETSFFPTLPSHPTIMLMDFEVKTGSALKIVVDRVQKEYPGSEIFFTAFGAMTREPDLRIKHFDQLMSATSLSELDIADCFIACTMHPPGIEPPLELR